VVWGYSVSGDMWTWFYVPKGTKEIQFYAQRCGGGSLGIRDPKGHWVGESTEGKRSDGRYFKSDGSYRTIPVPKGTDGAMWTLHCSPGIIRFFNIPTILSLRSDALFVPKELAKRDGLVSILPPVAPAAEAIDLDVRKPGPVISPLLFSFNLEHTRQAMWRGTRRGVQSAEPLPGRLIVGMSQTFK
jgi:hypothetical protein